MAHPSAVKRIVKDWHSIKVVDITPSSCYVAIKISRSDRRQDEDEAHLLRRLAKGSTGHPGKDDIVQLLDGLNQEDLTDDIYIHLARVLSSAPSHPQRANCSRIKPKIGNVRAVDDDGNVSSMFAQTSTAQVPRYVVKPLRRCYWDCQSRVNIIPNNAKVELINFGERFLPGKTNELKYEFNYQAPELVLRSQLSPKGDI
ncbi:MAG: hypothetical protein Q9219_006088 [cf. Caloplaca sp. 3 TL-2023]